LLLFLFTHSQLSNNFNVQSPVNKVKALLKKSFFFPQKTGRENREEKYNNLPTNVKQGENETKLPAKKMNKHISEA